MKKILLLSFFAGLVCKLHAQGGNTCANALANPIVIGTTYPGQTTCGRGNDYTGTGSCLGVNYHSENDWYYYFCATQTGCVTLTMTNVSPGTGVFMVNSTISVFNGCPGTGTCLGSNYFSSGLPSVAVGASVNIAVTAGQCYYVVVDASKQGSSPYDNCANYTLTSSYSTPPVQAGGNDCTSAQSSPITIGTTYTGQTTCCGGNDYTGTGGCLPAGSHSGNDWFYYFCATQTGCVSFYMPNTKSGTFTQNGSASISVFNGCPGVGTCTGANNLAITAGAIMNGPFVTVNVTAGQCYYVVIDGSSNGFGSNCIDYDLTSTFTPVISQTPGGANCTSAQSNPITIGSTYTGQSTCCSGNNYTGTGSTCIPAAYYKSNDWTYYFCATQTGCVTLSMPNTSSGNQGLAVQASISVFNGCPGTGTCIGGNYKSVPVNSTISGPSITVNVVAGQCYYVVVDGNSPNTTLTCINYTLTSLFTPTLIQSPGGNTCPAAQANPITIGVTYTGQSTCCGGNDYTGATGSCSGSSHSANDWYYYFCATQTGCATFSLLNTSSGNPIQTASPNISVFNGCPGTGTCIAGFTASIPANTIAGGPSVVANVVAGQCYYLVIDGNTSSGQNADCINFTLTSSISPPISQIGGNTCAAATSNQITLGNIYPGQSTCCAGNDYTGANACFKPFGSYFGGNDWYYSFCASQTGFATVAVRNVSTPPGQSTQPKVRVLSGCPGSGTCIDETNLNPFPNKQYVNGDSITVMVYAGHCYVIIIEDFAQSSVQCMNYTLATTFVSTLQPGCTNMGFENGLNGWVPTTGSSVESPAGQPTPFYTIDGGVGAVTGRHTIVTTGTDPCGAFPVVAPGGGTASLQLGNTDIDRVAEQVTQTFVVTPSNVNFTYKYALVLQDAGHNATQQPFFRAVVKDKDGNTIPCSDYVVAASAGTSGFLNSATCFFVTTPPTSVPVLYKPWSTVNVNLSAYMGQQVTVQFTVGSCTLGAHYGYAYIDCSCSPSIFQSDTICFGQSSLLQAPAGYSNYLWQPGNQTTPSVTVTPSSTTIYTVTLTAFNGCALNYTDTIKVMHPSAGSPFVSNITCNGVNNGSVNIIPTGGASPYKYSWSSPVGQTSNSATGLSAGSYSVTITDAAGCTNTTIVAVISPPPLIGQFTKGTANCTECGCKEWVMVNAAGGLSPYSFTWSDGYINRYKNKLCPNIYNINIKDKNGCSVNVNITAP